MATEKPRSGLFSSLFLMYLILILHGLVIVLFALLVVFFRGVVTYLPWIMLAGGLLVVVSGWILWRKFRHSQLDIKALLDNPVLRDRAVELRFLGGVATVRLGAPGSVANSMSEAIEYRPIQTVESVPQLEDVESIKLKQLARLIKLRESGELNEMEFQDLKKTLLPPGPDTDLPESHVHRN
jgi:hypothetical protein